jgi:hypothetical protein
VPHGGIFTVILSATTRTLTVEWLNPRGGAITAVGTTVAGPANESFIPPFSGDAAPYLVDAAGHNWVTALTGKAKSARGQRDWLLIRKQSSDSTCVLVS